MKHYDKESLEAILKAGTTYLHSLEFELSDPDYELAKDFVTNFEKKLKDQSNEIYERCRYCHESFAKKLDDPVTYCTSCRERLKNEKE